MTFLRSLGHENRLIWFSFNRQMYNLIRGRGLTYGVSMSSSVTEGRMRVKFTRSSQLRDGIQ